MARTSTISWPGGAVSSHRMRGGAVERVTGTPDLHLPGPGVSPSWRRRCRASPACRGRRVAVEGADELLTQQTGFGRRTEQRRHHEFGDRDALVNVDRSPNGFAASSAPARRRLSTPAPARPGRPSPRGKRSPVAGLDLHVHPVVGRQRKIVGRSRFGLRQWLTRHQQPAAAHQVGDQGGLPIAPHPRARWPWSPPRPARAAVRAVADPRPALRSRIR